MEQVQRGLKRFKRLRSGGAIGNMKAMCSKRKGKMGKLQKELSGEAKYIKLKYSSAEIKQEWYMTVGNDRKIN